MQEEGEEKADHEQLDVGWMVEHAAQVHKMLPGQSLYWMTLLAAVPPSY